jgi:hypothetical protein
MQFLRSSGTAWTPNRGDEMSRALAFSFLLIFVAYPLHPEELLVPITEDLLPSGLKLPTMGGLPSREPDNFISNVSEVGKEAEEEVVELEEEEDLMVMSRALEDEKLLVQLGYTDVLFVQPCFAEERGGIVRLAASGANTKFLLALSEPAPQHERISEQKAVGKSDENVGDKCVCDSAENIFTALLERLDGVESLFFLSGKPVFFDWIRNNFILYEYPVPVSVYRDVPKFLFECFLEA